MISVVQIFSGSHAVRSLNSRKSVISVALYDVGKFNSGGNRSKSKRAVTL